MEPFGRTPAITAIPGGGHNGARDADLPSHLSDEPNLEGPYAAFLACFEFHHRDPHQRAGNRPGPIT